MSGILVLVTCPANESEALARALVEDGLAACVNVISGVRSIYKWEGKVCEDSENLLVIKSSPDAWESLRDRVKELHSYDVPEIVKIPIEDGYKPYIDWLHSVVTAGQ